MFSDEDPKPGDIVATVNGVPVATLKEFWAEVQHQKEDMIRMFSP